MDAMVESPLRLFFEWFDTVHPLDKGDIALYAAPLLRNTMQEPVSRRDLGVLLHEFQWYLDQLKQADNAKSYGCLAALAGIIDFYLATRSTGEDWVLRRARRMEIERRAHADEGTGDAALLASQLAEVELELSERQARHLKYAKQWADLRQTELSPAYLGYWLTRIAEH